MEKAEKSYVDIDSNTLTSVKGARSLSYLFIFRESEESLKRTLGGFLFRWVLKSLKK